MKRGVPSIVRRDARWRPGYLPPQLSVARGDNQFVQLLTPRWSLRGLVALAAVLAAAVPAASLAASIDLASDRTALGAYHRYVSVLVGGTRSGARADHRYVKGVRGTCGGVLTPLASVSASQLNQRVLLDFGEEVGGDLAVAFDTEAVAPFDRLAAALGRLHWSSPQSARTVSSLLAAERRSLKVAPSKLCADARALVAKPSTEPHGTRAFLARYLPAANLSKRRLAPFLSLLARYQTAGEAKVIASIRTRVARFNAASKAQEKADGIQLLAALGLR